MKILKAILRPMCLVVPVLLAAGCIGEDRSDCPPPQMPPEVPPIENNVKIDFTLFDGEGPFTDEITSVIAVLFDDQGTYIPPAITLDKAMLDRYPGLEMTLAPGEYRMVFWANVGENTEIRVVDGTPVIIYKNADGSQEQVLGNGDPVWYAPAVAAARVDANAQPLDHHDFTVTADGNFTDQVAFTQTHHSVNVYIDGLPLDAASMPTVEITGLACAAEFYGMAPLDEPLPCITSSVRTTIAQKDDKSYALAAFETSPLGAMEDMQLVVVDAVGDEIYRVPLADAITQSGADPVAHETNLLLTFSTDNGNLTLTVEITEWDDEGAGKIF